MVFKPLSTGFVPVEKLFAQAPAARLSLGVPQITALLRAVSILKPLWGEETGRTVCIVGDNVCTKTHYEKVPELPSILNGIKIDALWLSDAIEVLCGDGVEIACGVHDKKVLYLGTMDAQICIALKQITDKDAAIDVLALTELSTKHGAKLKNPMLTTTLPIEVYREVKKHGMDRVLNLGIAVLHEKGKSKN
jgi:hypothetical protein